MPAHSKAELLDLSQNEFSKLEALLDTIPPELAAKKCVDQTSIKDVIAHRAYWIRLFMGWYADGQAGKDVSFPADGYTWNQLNDFNERIRASQGHLSCTVTDQGKEMPNGTPPMGHVVDPDCPIEDLPEGGFGWFLIRELTQELCYQRRQDQNVLNFHMALDGPED